VRQAPVFELLGPKMDSNLYDDSEANVSVDKDR
jgi:hypothetical protein